MTESTEKEWLLLIHQIPPKPDYFRVKIWRRLQQVGAIAVKQSVYVLPRTEQAHEDFSWILKEVVEGGGDAWLCEARFLEGITEEHLTAMFQDARRVDYERVMEEARGLLAVLSENSTVGTTGTVSSVESQGGKLQKRLHDIHAIDFFGAPEGGAAEVLIANVLQKVKGVKRGKAIVENFAERVNGRTWVTRENVYVDRIACAWLIKTFIDPDATFKFVKSGKYKPKKDELRFDMFDAEYTHDGDHCTFEVMIEQFGLDQKELSPLAEIVHDIDLKDEKFGRPEAAGLKTLLSGMVMGRAADHERIERGGRMFDDLHEYFKRYQKK